MRKTLLILFIIGGLSVLLSVSGRQHKANSLQTKDTRIHNRTEERLEISFKFQRGGIASSQYAIWIENDEGQLVRTIYTTFFTAKGGYKYRKDAIPFWVSKANPKDMSSEQVDAITGATPRNGILVYQWDGTDEKGNHVPTGDYKLFIEGTLYWTSRVMYSGEFTWGNKELTSVPVKVQHFNQQPNNQNMITELKVCHFKN
ncbi:DUF2271 domain-containing protein [Bacteroides uniformis]|uniref:DUF2271 domain-containing protein n=1 Tax=Bacteroides uniformis TaxID=820 RepID=UPI00233F6156|nr:DUF2271 domain-containing protein [Bacteroides uniformis]MDC1810896.1 DUF2271 domain-containing protein [Bacteroides uniformis]